MSELALFSGLVMSDLPPAFVELVAPASAAAAAVAVAVLAAVFSGRLEGIQVFAQQQGTDFLNQCYQGLFGLDQGCCSSL